MTKIELIRNMLIDIGGFTKYTAKQLSGKQTLKKDLKIPNERLNFLASRLTLTLKTAGSSKWVMAATLKADGYKVVDCGGLMLQKAFDHEAKPEEINALITEAKKEL